VKYEITYRLTSKETVEFESSDLAKAYAFGRAEKSKNVSAVVQSIIQIDPPLERECPVCHPPKIPALPAPVHDDDGREIEIDLDPSPQAA
jgi:hypothetical protein